MDPGRRSVDKAGLQATEHAPGIPGSLVLSTAGDYCMISYVQPYLPVQLPTYYDSIIYQVCQVYILGR
jgi:hypothetical protein